jgi:hypothetical protein
LYDNPYWEFHLPINPPINPGSDIDVNGDIYVHDENVKEVSLMNWWDGQMETYRPRPTNEFRLTLKDMTEELEYDCE